MYLRLIYVLSMLLFFCAWPVSASKAPLANYFHETWTTRDGLPHNTINDITQTADGYLWLATWEGAARYDGRQFLVFGRNEIQGLPDSGVRAFTLDPEGRLLLGGSRGGLARQRLADWQVLPPVDKLINDLHLDPQGRLWIATEGAGLMMQQPDGSIRQFSAQANFVPSVIYRLQQDARGHLWLATQQGLYWLDTKLAEPIFHPVLPAEGIPQTAIFSFAVDAKGQLLVGTEQGAFVQQGQQFMPLHPELKDIAVSVLLFDQKQNLWLGTINHGLLRLSELGLERMTVQEGLPNNRILSLWQDRERSIWVGTNGGLLRLRDAPFTNLTIQHGVSDNYVRTLLQHSDGSVWIGTSDGLDQYREGKVNAIGAIDGKGLTSVLSLAEAMNGDVWVGSYTEGALRLRAGSVIARYDRSHGLPANEVRAILTMPDDSVWLGTSGGLVHLNQERIKVYHVADGLPGEFITALARQDNGKIWIGTGSGLAVLQQGQFQKIPIHQLEEADYVFDFFQPSGSEDLWLTSDRGLIFYDASQETLALVGKKAGLPFEKYFAILAEEQNFFWLSSNRGIVRVRQQDVLAVATGAKPTLVGYEVFGESDGMLSAQANGGSMRPAVSLKNGQMWFATSQGVAMIDPARLSQFAIHTPPVVMQKVSVDGKTYPSTSLILPAGTRRLEMQFAGLSYVMPTRIQYRTKLAGFDQDWVERGPQPFAEYTNLTPGTYQFFVSAAYPDGDWSDEPAKFQFVIQPFFYQRPVFIVGVLLSILMLFLLIYRWRIASLERSATQLRHQVQLQTAALREQASVLIEAVEEKSKLAEQLRIQAAAFSAQAREDGLTGLSNRRAFDEQLASEFSRAERSQRPLCLAILDVDHFKKINDQWSHMAGDQVLIRLAAILKHHCRDIDMTARWGGEEFALLLPDTALEQGREICERLRQAIEQMDCQDIAAGLRVTASFGLSVNTGLAHYDKLISRADALLYQAKTMGRNQVCG